MNQKKVLVVAAHPDDEVLGCGGTVLRLIEEGCEVYSLILSNGVTSRYDKPELADMHETEALQTAAYEAAEVLGVSEVFIYNFPDNRFDTVPLLDIVKVVEKTVNDIKPQVIYTHHAGDLNIDHQIVNKTVLTATRPVSGQVVKEIYAFQVPSSTDWAFNKGFLSFQPNVFVDIGSTLERKLKALSCYKSELRKFPHPRSVEAITASAKSWGSVAGCSAAEAFEHIRKLY